MATATFIPIDQYLRKTYRPDCDYVDGEVRERNLGEQPHAFAQAIIGSMFHQHWKEWSIVAGISLRIRVSATRIRVADICVMRRSDPPEPVVLVAPLICVEVLSSEDTLDSLRERVDDYLHMGTRHVWLIDPFHHKAWTATCSGYDEIGAGVFIIPDTQIRISPTEIFSELDER